MAFLSLSGSSLPARVFGGQPSYVLQAISNLKLWISADWGVFEGFIRRISEIQISNAGTTAANGTYYRDNTEPDTFYQNNIGGTQFGITWVEARDPNPAWVLFAVNNSDSYYYKEGYDLEQGSWANDTAAGHADDPAPSSSVTWEDGDYAVQQVLDQSGNENDLFYSSGTPRLSPDVIKTFPAINFGFGNPGRLVGQDISYAKTVFCVIQNYFVNDAPTEYSAILDVSGGGLYKSMGDFDSSWGSYFNNYKPSDQLIQTGAFILGSVSDDGINYKYTNNGATVLEGSDGDGFADRSELYLGNNSANTQPASCYVAELAVFDRALSNDEQAFVEQYLNEKYGVY